MRKTTIQFQVELDDKNIPERISWEASDKPEATPEETKALCISLWDDRQKNTLRIDLWAKDMPVLEMKRFYIDCLGGLAQSIKNATNDEFMSQQTHELCARLVDYLRNQKDDPAQG